jgi:prepilin-type processing-associated H-X9-DG protein
MSFSLSTILWAFALLAAAMATFGPWGVLFAVGVCLFWATVFSKVPVTVVELLVIVAIMGTLIGLLLPATKAVRSSARVMECHYRLWQLATALHMHLDQNGAFPMAAQPHPADSGGPPHSWRVAILPQLYQAPLLAQFRFDQPWNSPHNIALGNSALEILSCPSDPPVNPISPTTNYFAIVDPRSAWHPDRRRRLRDFTDGPRNTIMLIECAGRNTPWSKPEDLTFAEALALLTTPTPDATMHRHRSSYGFFYKVDDRPGLNVAFADGSVRFLALPLSTSLATALLTADGGELVDERELDRATLPQLDCGKIYALATFIALSLLPGVRWMKARGMNWSAAQTPGS